MGSEMCIRDSSKGGPGLRDLALGELEREGVVGREHSAHHAPEAVPGEAGMLGGYDDSVGGLNRQQSGCIHRELNSRCARLWLPGGFNGPR